MDEQVRALLGAVRDDPRARDELLRALLTDRFLDLPARVDAVDERLAALAEAQLRTQTQLQALTQRVDALTQRVDALTQRVDALTQRVDALARRIEELVDAQKRTEIAVQTLADRFAKQLPKIDTAIGYVVERRYHERASAYFAPIARRIRVLDRTALDELIDDALERGALSPFDARALWLADTIATARRGDETVYLVVESSYTVDERDVERAVDRARVLARLVGTPTLPVVAGEYIDEDAQRRSREESVYQVLDGTVTGPDGLVLV